MNPRLLIAASLAMACSEPADPVAREATPSGTGPSSASAADSAAPPEASASAAIAPGPAPIPTLVGEDVPALADTTSLTLYRANRDLLIATEKKVGRLSAGNVEWSAGVFPGDSMALGPTALNWVGGEWPDRIDVTFSYANPRSPVPSYWPLTGKGGTVAFAPGGGGGVIAGVARVGETTLVAGWDFMDGQRIMTARGPALRRSFTPASTACKPGEVTIPEFGPAPTAVHSYAFGATPAGTLLSIGSHCDKRGIAAEIWDDKGQAKIVSLNDVGKGLDYGIDILPGQGDSAYLFESGKGIVAFESGSFKQLPSLPRPPRNAFVSGDGQLFANDGTALHRLDAGAWVLVGHLAWPTTFGSIAFQDGAFWVTQGGRLKKLVPGKSVAYSEGCATPFVYLYDVSWKSEPTYTFPTTRKALSTFPDVAKLKLVEFNEGARRLGLIVPSKEVGEAAIAHVKANMKDEDPKMLCYQPSSTREIALGGKK